MQRNELSHILRAIHSATGETEFEIYGSQAILGNYDYVPDARLSHSDEVDVYVPNNPSLSDFISANFGRNTHFESSFGYYADGIDLGNLILPCNYRNRMIGKTVPLYDEDNTIATVWFLSMEDICAAKLNAGREKDFIYVAAARDNGLVDEDIFEQCCYELGNHDYLMSLYHRDDLEYIPSYF